MARAKAADRRPAGLPLTTSGRLRLELGLDLRRDGRLGWDGLLPALAEFGADKPAFCYRTSAGPGLKTFVDWYQRAKPAWLIGEVTPYVARDEKSGDTWEVRFIHIINLGYLASAKIGRRKSDFHRARKLGRRVLAQARAGKSADALTRRMMRLYEKQGFTLYA